MKLAQIEGPLSSYLNLTTPSIVTYAYACEDVQPARAARIYWLPVTVPGLVVVFACAQLDLTTASPRGCVFKAVDWYPPADNGSQVGVRTGRRVSAADRPSAKGHLSGVCANRVHPSQVLVGIKNILSSMLI